MYGFAERQCENRLGETHLSLSLSLCLSEFVVSRIIVHFFLDERRRSRLFVSPKLARAFRQEQRLLFRNWAN